MHCMFKPQANSGKWKKFSQETMKRFAFSGYFLQEMVVLIFYFYFKYIGDAKCAYGKNSGQENC